jgi:cytochrome P450
MTRVGPDVTLAELDVDPYLVYARLRRDEPVSRIPELGQWLVTSWRDVSYVLGEPELFTTDVPDSPTIRFCGGTPMLLREGHDHQDIREAFIHDYDPHRVNDYVDTIVRPHARKVAAGLVSAGQAELIDEYFEPVAALSEATLLGVPGGADTLRRWGNALANAAANFSKDPEIDAQAVAALADSETVGPAIERLRAQPDWSVISHLIYANRPAGRPDSDVLPVLKHIAMSVIEPGWLAGWTLLALLAHPGQFSEVRNNRGLLGAAVYEALRWSGPVGTLTRRTTQPVTLGGKDLPAGAMLVVSIASANRDESVFPNADDFDVRRTVVTHLGLGAGRHHCPAFAFVPAIARTALDVLFDQLPDLTPAPGWKAEPHGWKLRLPGPVNVTWERNR